MCVGVVVCVRLVKYVEHVCGRVCLSVSGNDWLHLYRCGEVCVSAIVFVRVVKYA